MEVQMTTTVLSPSYSGGYTQYGGGGVSTFPASFESFGGFNVNSGVVGRYTDPANTQWSWIDTNGFEVFDLSHVHGTITSLSLKFVSFNFFSGDFVLFPDGYQVVNGRIEGGSIFGDQKPSETFDFYAVNTPVSELVTQHAATIASTNSDGVSVYNDLGSGAFFGDATLTTKNNFDGAPQTIELNSNAVLFADAQRDTGFKIGIDLQSVTHPEGVPDFSWLGTDHSGYLFEAGEGISLLTVSLIVESENNPPVAVDDTATTFRNSAIDIGLLGNDHDPDGDTLTVLSTGDPEHGTLSWVGETLRYQPNLNYVGNDQFDYIIADGFGAFDVGTAFIAVSPRNGTTDAVDDSFATDRDFAVEVPVLDNDIDPDGDTLHASVIGGPVHGTLSLAGPFVYVPDPGYIGTDSFTYLAFDDFGGSDVATVSLVVRPPNNAPDAVDDTVSTGVGAPILIPVRDNDSDPDGDPLSILEVGAPSHGQVLAIAGQIGYLPDPEFIGTDTFTYQIWDGRPNGYDTATVTVTVGPINHEPVAADDQYATDEDQGLVVPAKGILANDSDNDGDSLSAVLVSGPTHGTVVLNADGAFSYTPAPNYNGPDSFTYHANDGSLDSNVATVSLTVNPVNDAPVAANDSYATDEDVQLMVATPGVRGNDSDVDNDPFTAALVSGPAHGSLALSADGSFVYSPNHNYNGPDSFTYKTSDGGLDSNVATVSLTVNSVNDAPIGAADSANVEEDASVQINVLTNDSDPDGDALSIQSLSGSKSALGASIEIVNGHIQYTADADQFDLSTFSGAVDEFTYVATDPNGGKTDPVTVQVTVTPANDACVINGTVRPDVLNDEANCDATIHANNGNDVVHGFDGSDIIYGENGDDQLYGGTGRDFLFGSTGNDTLDGGDGNDLLEGGQGNDLMAGGAGSDTFKFAKNCGVDTASDFATGIDHLLLEELTVQSLASSDVDHTGPIDAVVSFAEGGSVTLLNVGAVSDWHNLV
jgi:VCBS repeat-containing protein